jgi:outer membrane protein TolC
MLAKHRRAATIAACVLFIAAAAPAAGLTDSPPPAGKSPASLAPAQHLFAGMSPPLRALASEVLERNPSLKALEADVRAALQIAPQSKALPNPTLGVTAFVAPPETRVGPQRLMLTLAQQFPGGGKRGARERAAQHHAEALAAATDARRLVLVTTLRKLALELAFLDRQQAIIEDMRAHLVQHEEIARARYSTGVGLGQGVIKIQVELTEAANRLIGLDQARVRLREQINALRDRAPGSALPRFDLAAIAPQGWQTAELTSRALASRPELAAASAEIEHAQALLELSDKQGKLDWSLGLTYTFVDRRQDAPGQASPPPDDGSDVFGIQGGLVLPVRKTRIASGREEAEARRQSASQRRRAQEADIRSRVAELARRLDLFREQHELLQGLLVIQAEESLQSAQSAYVSGGLNALDLLDAEHALFNAQSLVARSHADYLIALAELEGVVGQPLTAESSEETP